MCTAVISNKNKTIVGWNLDILNMRYRVRPTDDGVYIEIDDAKEGWLPLFGANKRGDFVSMPTCWPFDQRSDPVSDSENILMLDIDFLLQKKTLAEIHETARRKPVSSVPGVTFQSQLSDKEGNVLQIVPGQGFRYMEKPEYAVMTNFSPYKGNSETHPWMGWDRYQTAVQMLERAEDNFGTADCFEILKATAQIECPTVVSMVFDVSENTVYWCENRDWAHIQRKKL
ncbi:MAG: hypothetical protein ACI3W6_05545 [Clostridia bacterium]